MRVKTMKNSEMKVNIELNFDEIQTISGVFFHYYQSLTQQHMCDTEKLCEKTILKKLVEAEREIHSKYF